MDIIGKFKELNELRDENEQLMQDVIDLKNKRLTYQEARIDALEREVERLKEELNAMYNQLNEKNER
jgi:polyhydroxyalkanoate synthesis regulator phasin